LKNSATLRRLTSRARAFSREYFPYFSVRLS
jgi:hypothetical protein